MKTKLITMTALAIALLFFSAAQAADTLKQQYIDVRYKVFDCAGTTHIDMADVSIVRRGDTHVVAFDALGNKGVPYDLVTLVDKWWIYMKNGNIQYCASSTKAKEAFEAYVAFLRAHPEFLNMP